MDTFFIAHGAVTVVVDETVPAKGPNGGPIPKWASDFDTWVKDSLLNGRYMRTNNYEEKVPDAKKNHPSLDHFFPLHVALGAVGHGSKAKLIHHSWTDSVISYASYRFTAAM
ncbi:extradiol ring-cleavage dioxygenase-like protein [Carex littledalei]|uniref:Extradiol ring-cleavage dioxygenase-like protein n=1 Tax=Carex littledalei TaxID=544730 RepID=A0A833VHR9_9POAL|nr:extradiol ring-cleavage dioxygenase-like protein [Carex littledalei]